MPGLRPADPVIKEAREATAAFSETLQNYVVKQFTTRFQSDASRKGQNSWHALDNLTADLVYENGKESYTNVRINGVSAKESEFESSGWWLSYSQTASALWSTGEYSSVLVDVLSPNTDADFDNKRSVTTIANQNHATFRYGFSVEKSNSHWTVRASSQSYVPEYTGSIWIDKETFRVLRIELAARNLPVSFALDTVESAVDYDYVLIGDAKVLLPVHSEALICVRGTSQCGRNVIDFRNYRKISGHN